MLDKAKILIKLSVDKDLRTVEKQEVEGGKISLFFKTVSLKFSEMVKVQLFFLIFAIPALLILAMLMPMMVNSALSEFVFETNMGIGYSSAVNAPSEGIVAIYQVYRLILSMMIPAIIFAGIGLAGVFYCSRGFMWYEPVVVYKAFFRGIKKLWKKFLPTISIYAILIAGIGMGILYGLQMIELGTADFLSYFVLVLSILFGLIAIMIAILLFPMFACYEFKMSEYLKNSVLLNILVAPPTIILAILTIVPFILFSLSSITNMIFYTMLVVVGITFIAMMWTAYAQNVFDTMIQGMYQARKEAERKKAGKDKSKAKKEFVNPKKKAKSNNKPKEANQSTENKSDNEPTIT